MRPTGAEARSLLWKNLSKEGHLRSYIKEIDYELESGQAVDRVTVRQPFQNLEQP